jgi:dTDP-4-amino-4,6-dideoxygalactose transaminase
VRPYFPALETISSRLSRALNEGCITNNGPYVQDFEALLAKYLGAPVLCFGSGQAALTAMLMASEIQGQEVIIPSFTFAATPNAVLAAGGIPVFADVSIDTLTLSPIDVEKRITEQTGAILAVDAYGIGADYQILIKIAKKHRIKLLRDSAPAFGTICSGQNDVTGIYSFHATKAFAVGEGGCIVSHDESLMARAKLIRNFGLDKNHAWRLPGINGKMTEISAIIGIQSLKGWPDRLNERQKVKARLDAVLTGIDGLTVIMTPAGQSVSWCYAPALIDPIAFGCSRDELQRQLEANGIYTRKYYPACHMENFISDSDPLGSDLRGIGLPRTERSASQVLALPCYESMTMTECQRIGDTIRNIQNMVSTVYS